MLKNILGDYIPMLEVLFEELEELGLELPEVSDHICYRVETNERYRELKEELLAVSDLAGEEMVSGRLISIFKLNGPIEYKNYLIDCLELPAPKEGRFYKEGWEHIEFVVSDLDRFLSRYPENYFKLSGGNWSINPEAGLKLTENYQVKFHPLHILEVLELEKAAGNSKGP